MELPEGQQDLLAEFSCTFIAISGHWTDEDLEKLSSMMDAQHV